MKYLLLLLISTTALAQTPQEKWQAKNPTEAARIMAAQVEYTVDDMKYQLSILKQSVRRSVADEGGYSEPSDAEKIVGVLDSFSRRLEALESHVTLEEKRIYTNINKVDSKVMELGARSVTPVDTTPTPYVPPQKLVTKPDRYENNPDRGR